MTHKSPLFSKITFLSAAILLASCASLSDSDRFLYLDTADTLQIRFHHTADPRLAMDAPSIADETEKLRFRDYYGLINALLANIGLPMEYRVLERGEQPEPGHPVLDLAALRWGQTSFGEIEAVLQARLISYGERNTLGTFVAKELPPPSMSQDIIDRAYVDTMRESLTKMLSALLTHFEVPVDYPEPYSTPASD